MSDTNSFMDPQEVVATGEVAAGEMSDCLGKVDAVLESTATLESSAWQFCDLQQSWQACDGGILEDKVPKRYDGREVHCVCLGSMVSAIGWKFSRNFNNRLAVTYTGSSLGLTILSSGCAKGARTASS